MIYTSYFANIRNIPDNVVPISICGKVPDWWKGLQYKKLAPKWSFFKLWKYRTEGYEECYKNNEYYIKSFEEQILNKLNINEVLQELYKLSGKSKNIVLICYEKPSDFCHRHLVADWMESNGVEIKEWKEDIL